MRTQKIRWFAWPLLLAAAVLFWGCQHDDQTISQDTIVGSGVIVSQQRTPGTFTGIRIVGVAKVCIRQDSADSLRIEADDNIIERVTSTVSQGVLIVGLTNGSYSNVTVNVYATMTIIHSLEINGSGDIVTTSPIQSDNVTCSIAGAGSITLNGVTTHETVTIAGAGSIHNFGLTSSQCSASIVGTGSIEVHASRQLDALIAGVGTITYAGNPTIVNSTMTGVGTIQPK